MVLPFASAREVGRVIVVILDVSEGGSLMVRRGDADGCVLLVARRSRGSAGLTPAAMLPALVGWVV